MRSGLEALLDDPSRLSGAAHPLTGLRVGRGARVGLVCNHTAVDRELRHAIDLLQAAGVNLVRLFGPEHGVRATAQMMVDVDEARDPVSGLPTVSLYGSSAASLHPAEDALADLDVVLFDIQDIGTRYYTYQATLGFVMRVAGKLGVKVIVLDRPNPIGGVVVEGNTVNPGFESFVGAFPLAVRHGMTVGEIARWFVRFGGVSCELEVVACDGWRRSQWFDQTGLPWVYPSPNMPTLDTAIVYPGMCLVEATNISEGRGTTRPFHLLGAPWLDPQKLVALAAAGAERAGLVGARFRPAAFIPSFEKHTGEPCTGMEVHVVDRDRLAPLLLGLVALEAVRAADPERFGWRTEPYEFIADVPAIDLLTGSAEYRTILESGGSVRDLVAGWEPQRQAFLAQRAECLIYG